MSFEKYLLAVAGSLLLSLVSSDLETEIILRVSLVAFFDRSLPNVCSSFNLVLKKSVIGTFTFSEDLLLLVVT